MSTIALDRLPPDVRQHPPLVATVDNRRGTAGMWLLIVTEAALFLMLFFSYFYLARDGWQWPHEAPPKLRLAIPMSILLWASSGVIYWGERNVEAGRKGAGRMALAITFLMGLVFLIMQAFEYYDHLKTLTPQTDAYGSIFYTITTFHAAHVVGGLLMLAYAFILPRWEPAERPPHRPYHNAAIYWHFVDFVWLVVFAVLYIGPNVR